MRGLLIALTGFSYVVVLLPILIVVVTAFSASEFFAFPPKGFSLRWFEAFFASDSMRGAFSRSLQIATIASILATVLGTMASIAIARRKGTLFNLVQGMFLAPLIFPAIVLGLSLLIFYKSIGGVPDFLGLVIAHSVLGLPFVVRSVTSSMLAVDPALEEAGQSLKASPVDVFIFIIAPLIWPGMLAGGIFAFILSLGELNTALFLTGPGVTTLPIEIFSYLQFQGGQLVIAAASAIQIFMIIAIVLIAERLIGLKRIVRSES